MPDLGAPYAALLDARRQKRSFPAGTRLLIVKADATTSPTTYPTIATIKTKWDFEEPTLDRVGRVKVSELARKTEGGRVTAADFKTGLLVVIDGWLYKIGPRDRPDARARERRIVTYEVTPTGAPYTPPVVAGQVLLAAAGDRLIAASGDPLIWSA